MLSGAVAVVVTTGDAIAEVCTMMEGLVSVLPLGHLTAAMRMITRTAAPLDPRRGTFIESKESRNEVVGVSISESMEILLLTKTVSLIFS